MTLDEKWKALDMYCKNGDCKDCKLDESEGCNHGDFSPSEYERRINNGYAEVFGNGAEKPETSAEPDNVQNHHKICNELSLLYAEKNADYGDSFHKTFVEEGMAMARIRLSDKLERFKRLTKSNEQHVQDESVRDTLIDLANYAILTVMEMDGAGSGEE